MNPYKLTSQYAQGVRGAEDAAVDTAGREWYRIGRLDHPGELPVWPCFVCGHPIDPLKEPHWYQDTDELWLHVARECVTLEYPEQPQATS